MANKNESNMDKKKDDNKECVNNSEIDDEDWRFFINRASEVIKVYEHQTEYFVKMIVSFVVYYNILFVIYNALSKMILSTMIEIFLVAVLYGIYLFYTVHCILKITNKGDTKGIVSSIYFYRDYEPFTKCCNGEITHELKRDDFKKEYPRTMYNLRKYQKNYYDINIEAQKFFKRNIGLFCAFISISLGIIILI